MTLRVFTPRGQTSVHFPQSIHFDASLYTEAVSPLRMAWQSERKLKVVNFPAEQVAVQLPQAMQRSKVGSFAESEKAKSRLALSRSQILDFIDP